MENKNQVWSLWTVGQSGTSRSLMKTSPAKFAYNSHLEAASTKTFHPEPSCDISNILAESNEIDVGVMISSSNVQVQSGDPSHVPVIKNDIYARFRSIVKVGFYLFRWTDALLG